MSISTVPVTGSVVLPDGQAFSEGQAIFTLTEADTEGAAAIPAQSVIVPLDGIDLPAGTALWRNSAGVKGTTLYQVELQAMFARGADLTVRRRVPLGYIQLGAAASYDLGSLLAAHAQPGPLPAWIVDTSSFQEVPGEKWFTDLVQFLSATDPTKSIKFSADLIETDRTRVFKLPNNDGTLAMRMDFPGRPNAVGALTGQTWPDGTVARWPGRQIRAQAGATTISDLPGWVPDGDLWADIWPVDMTGANDDRAAWAAAISYASGKDLLVPAGIMNWVPTATPLTVGAKTRIIAAGQAVTTLRMATASTSFRAGFNLSNPDVVFRDFTFEFGALAASSQAFANISASRIRFERCTFDGKITGSPTASHSAYVLNINSAIAFDDIAFVECTFLSVSYSWLQSNATTAAHENIEFTRCRSLNCYNSAIGINSPNADLDSVNITGGIYENAQIVGTLAQAVSIATGHNIAVSNVVVKGYYWSALHFEEKVRNLNVSNVTGELVAGDFLDLSSNNISGTYYRPEQVAITGLVAEKVGAQGGYGIRITYDAAPISASNFTVISGATIKNFATGIQVNSKADDDVRIAGAEIIGCALGLYLAGSSTFDVSGLTLANCAVGVRAAVGGYLQNVTFHNCVETHQVDIGVLAIDGAKFNCGTVVIGAGTAVFPRLLRRVQRADCKALLRAYLNTTDRVSVLCPVAWDGTTETVSTSHTLSGGGALSAAVLLIDEASGAAVVAGGAGYTVGDTLTVQGGTLESSGTRTTATVLAVSGGVVTAVSIANPGEWATVPGAAAATTGGTGTGCTLTLTTVKTLVGKVFSGSAKSPHISVALSGVVFVN